MFSVCEEPVLLRPCQLSQQHHHKPSTKQKQAEHVIYDVTNKFGDNLRSTQEASLSTSLGPSPILIIVKPLFPVLFPAIHENDRNLTCCTSADTGAAVKQHYCRRQSVPECRRSYCPTRQWGSAAAPKELGTVSQLFCLLEISIQCVTPYPLHLCQCRVKCGGAKPSALGAKNPNHQWRLNPLTPCSFLQQPWISRGTSFPVMILVCSHPHTENDLLKYVSKNHICTSGENIWESSLTRSLFLPWRNELLFNGNHSFSPSHSFVCPLQ